MTARRVTWWLLIVALSAATIAAASVGAWQLVANSRPTVPVADKASARQAAMVAATTGAVRVLSYTPDTVEDDVNAAKALLTGDFLKSYDQLTSQTVIPGARAQRITSNATVAQAGVESLDDDSATILVFVDQKTTGNDRPEPTLTASSVRVGLTKVRGTWLIDRFDPV
ncbi:hypothetical protein EI067_04635 [Mycobacterium paragordonae]|uniref:hypothetical protein n=1 Tax=Mycobacterium paragordonae TaxID=1389713 RepID=UPI0010600877|nr:hypothetical protein [Mycobacterium paragordonae]TDL00265.1 hypothetical protein EI067_04635 [Mycobacterium paragordonae]